MITIIIALIFIVAIYFYNTRNFKYWEKRGVKHDKPIIFFGTGRETFLMRKSITQSFVDLYRKYPNEKVVGFFRSSTPGLLIRDPELIKHVLLTDFVHFYERGIHPDKRGLEPLLSNLFFAEGDLWRLLRQRMTPAFTSGKLKAMFPLIVERAEQLQARALDAARKGKAIDARDLMARYTTDFIGACGFGLDAGSLNEEESAFRKLGADIFKFDLRQVVVNVLKENFPRLTRQLKFLGHLENQIVTLVNDIQKQRNYQPSNRNDFIDLLLECKKKGIIKVESLEKVKPDGSPDYATLELDDLLIAAQVFVFFAAGFETSSSATSYTLHQLAYYPEVQKKVQADIDAVLSKHDNKLSYEAVKDMTYLDWTFREGMRKFPSLGYLARRCSRKYTFTDLNLTIDEGVMISIPLQALQTDPQYFDNPTEFRPERFDPKNGLANKFTYLPFGDGPRACIGERLGLMQSLAGLAAILSRFSVEPAPESHPVDPPVEPKFDVVQSVIDGLPLRFIERKKVE
ncbi:cytochrome P450 6B6-like isoform X1 [Ostrinia nubilalis]|uniref:cytochrome P450 6B6-like isoform X1 n=1 Tax=Ostrinia nubilalis TaxID=29057 RepID=UPI0030823633